MNWLSNVFFCSGSAIRHISLRHHSPNAPCVVLSKTAEYLAQGLTSVASGAVAYLFNDSLVTHSTSVDTTSNIENVTLSGNGINYVVGSSGANVIVGGTGVDTITAGAGNDTITGAGGADVIDAGAGNDTLVYLLTADLFSGNAEVDTSFAGGIGTDTLQVGTTGTAFVIANNDIWTGVTGVETISYVANTATTNTLALDVTAYAAGIRTIDQSAVTGATGNTIDISEFVGTDATTLTGSATGSTTITGGAGPDTITGGSAADIFVASAGNDIVAAGGGTIVDIFEFTGTLLAANSGTTATYDGGAGTDIVDITTDGAFVVDADFRGFTSIETFTTGDGVNSLILSTNADASGITTITGGDGADTIDISATAFNNTVTINVSGGIDTVRLGAQTATIVFTGTDVAGQDSDVITGFTSGTDKINLDALTTATGTTVLVGTQTNTVNTVYILVGQSAGAADTAANAATAAAAPPLDPPGVRVISHGFLPWSPNLLIQVPTKPNSGVLVLPSIMAPAFLTLSTSKMFPIIIF